VYVPTIAEYFLMTRGRSQNHEQHDKTTKYIDGSNTVAAGQGHEGNFAKVIMQDAITFE
jgi:hypothetical protein